MNEEESNCNTHFVQQFDRQRFEFEVEAKAIPERRRTGKLTVRLDQKTCHYGKPQKVHMQCAYVIAACKHINIDYLEFLHLLYTFKYVSTVYKVRLCNL
ncbi:hypothetical protein HKD37_14G039764 [Glycine soja]|nr:hypothetical protein GmHk_14G040704 [Glycine max]